MRRWGALVAVVIATVMVMSSEIGAQWPSYPTPDVPRTADGKPLLDGPAPRTPDGKVDFSGIWNLAFGGGGGGRGRGAGAPPQPPPPVDPNAIPISQFGEVAGRGYPLPLQPWAADARKQRSAANSADDPHAKCLPNNPPRSYTLPHFQKIIQTPYFIAMLTEFNASFRQVFTDGRPLPVDPNPSWTGYSTGRWEGDALVVRTNGLRDGMWLDMSGTPLTDAATLTERITRPSYGTLEIAFTVDDPKAYTKPWTVNLRQEIIVDTDLVEEICLEGLRPMHLPK